MLSCKKGMTLIELAIAMVLSSILLLGTLAYFIPALNAFTASKMEDELRLNVASAMDSLEAEVGSMRGIYVDANQCYALCMTDGNENRIYYYWSGGTLYRKQEATTGPISCSGGSAFATGLDPALVNFTASNSLLNATMGATASNGEVFSLSNTMLPSLRERDVILYEGFECASLSDGWTVTAGATSHWSITAGSSLGLYEIDDSATGDGVDTTSISIPLDLSRVSSAHLQFNYMNRGTISSPDTFTVYLYDGTNWNIVFTDTRGQSIPSFKRMHADLSGYVMNNSNQLKFTSSLSHAGSHWYVDGISVFVP